MYAFFVPPPAFHFESEVIVSLAHGLRQEAFAVAAGRLFRKSPTWDEGAWAELAACWDRLTLDQYMGDKGTYRYRRYGAFDLERAWGERKQRPHAPYRQAASINKLNGNVDRIFDPLEPVFVDSPVLSGLLHSLAAVFEAADGASGRWDIRLHPYRIVARPGVPGSPTPEGLHRDGVHYIVTLMVKRQNVTGGETMITDRRGAVVEQVTLSEPMDLVVANDIATMHAVTQIEPAIASEPATRDVLVIAYTRAGR